MAKLWITEFDASPHDTQFYGHPVLQEPAVAEQTPVDFTGGEAKSAALNAATGAIRLHADTNCHIRIGTNPTATTNDQRLAAGEEYVRAVRRGEALKVSAIAAA